MQSLILIDFLVVDICHLCCSEGLGVSGHETGRLCDGPSGQSPGWSVQLWYFGWTSLIEVTDSFPWRTCVAWHWQGCPHCSMEQLVQPWWVKLAETLRSQVPMHPYVSRLPSSMLLRIRVVSLVLTVHIAYGAAMQLEVNTSYIKLQFVCWMQYLHVLTPGNVLCLHPLSTHRLGVKSYDYAEVAQTLIQLHQWQCLWHCTCVGEVHDILWVHITPSHGQRGRNWLRQLYDNLFWVYIVYTSEHD